jgi:magnesium-transporting ATPase (P-type)
LNLAEGAEIEAADAATLLQQVETTTIFAKLAPLLKAHIIALLRQRGHYN